MANKGAFIAITGLALGGFVLAKIMRRPVYATAVYDEMNASLEAGNTPGRYPQFLAIDPAWDGTSVWALGKPDGLPAYIYGSQGSFLALSLFASPTMVKKLSLYLINVYDVVVTHRLHVEVSNDGINWLLISQGLGGEVPANAHVVVILPINAPIRFIRLIMGSTGVSWGIDAVEAIK